MSAPPLSAPPLSAPPLTGPSPVTGQMPLWPAMPVPQSAPPMPPPPVAPRATRSRLPWIIGIAVLLVVGLCAGAGIGVVLAAARLKDGYAITADTADQLLRAAARSLAGSAGVKLTGTVSGSGGGDAEVAFEATNRGGITGTMLQSGQTVQFLHVNGRPFIRADAAYWQQATGILAPGVDSAARVAFLAKRWVAVDPDTVGADPDQVLTPGRLGERLLELAKPGMVKRVGETTHKGVESYDIATPLGTVSVAKAAPHRVVRVTSEGQVSGPEASGSPSPPRKKRAGDEFELFVDRMPVEQVEALVQKIDAKAKELADAIDARVTFEAKPTLTLSPCGNFGCTVNVTIENKIRSRSPYYKTDQPVEAIVEVSWTYDGRPIGSCIGTVTLPPNGSAAVTFTPHPCSVTYTTPADGRTHQIYAQVQGYARAMVQVDLAEIANKLAKQSTELKMCLAGPHGLPGWSARHGGVQYIPPKSLKPGEALPMRNGGYVDDMDNVWQLGRPSEAVKGFFSKEWDVQLTDRGRQSWDQKGWPRKDKDHANITPDGFDSHGTQPARGTIPSCDNS
jgi:hypothetical protein